MKFKETKLKIVGSEKYMAFKNPIPSFDDDINKNEIQSEEQTLDYTPCSVYFAFIDVLGFQKTFNDIELTNDKGIIKNYGTVFNQYFAMMDETKFIDDAKNVCYAGQTSDSLYFYTERSDFLVEFLETFSLFNLYAMSQNVFFRGGIAKGQLFRKKKYQFYGDSVIRAYLLESVISKNPVIMIDEKTHSDLENNSNYNKMTKTKNKRHYLYPFYSLKQDLTKNGEVFKHISREKIEEIIENNISKFEFDEKNRDKYVFLSNELKKLDNE